MVSTDSTLPAEGFRLTIDAHGVWIKAADPAGAFYARQALRQLLGPAAFRAVNIHSGPYVLPCGVVEDWPRFRWRGCLLDVARHFMPKAGVLRFLDLMAAHRLNVLHFHLTDDQGWRVEVPAFPRLTEVGAWRAGSWVGRPPNGTPGHDGRPHGGYYTVDDLREIVAYAAERHITVVPEIDVPGHSQAAIAAYPWLGVTGEPFDVLTSWGINENVLAITERTVDFYRQVLTHVTEIFPSEVICVGGDEVPTTQWAADPATVARVAELGLSSMDELRGWFLGRLVEHLESLGRRAMAWDDAGRLPSSTIVAAWRAGREAMAAGHEIVLCPRRTCTWTIASPTTPTSPSRSATSAPWRRRVQPTNRCCRTTGTRRRRHRSGPSTWTTPRRVDYAAFPRLAAFAEVVWSPRDPRLRGVRDPPAPPPPAEARRARGRVPAARRTPPMADATRGTGPHPSPVRDHHTVTP